MVVTISLTVCVPEAFMLSAAQPEKPAIVQGRCPWQDLASPKISWSASASVPGTCGREKLQAGCSNLLALSCAYSHIERLFSQSSCSTSLQECVSKGPFAFPVNVIHFVETPKQRLCCCLQQSSSLFRCLSSHSRGSLSIVLSDAVARPAQSSLLIPWPIGLCSSCSRALARC